MTMRQRSLRAIPCGPIVPEENGAEHSERALREGECTIAAPPADLSGEPGERTMECTGFALKGSKRKVAVAIFADVDTGEVARKWYDLAEQSARSSKLWRDVALALGRSPHTDEQIDLVATFVGRRFRVWVGYRKTPNAKGRGGRASDELARRRKDDADYLRVHELLERLA